MQIWANKQGGRTIHQEAVLPAALIVVVVSDVGQRVRWSSHLVVFSVIGWRV